MSDRGVGVGVTAHRVHIVDISPPPPDDQIVAIAMALDQAWPEPQGPTLGGSGIDEGWRFASRPWRRPAIPVRRWDR